MSDLYKMMSMVKELHRSSNSHSPILLPMHRFYYYSGTNQGGSPDIPGFGSQQHVTRRYCFSNGSSNQVPTFDPFSTRGHFFGNIDSSPLLPAIESSMITHPFFRDDSPSPLQLLSKAEPSFYREESSAFPSKYRPSTTNQPRYRDDASSYRPSGGDPINFNVNVNLKPQDLQDQRYPRYDNYNGQTGGGQYNPQVQGGNHVNGDGKVNMGPELNGGNVSIGPVKARGGNVGGKKEDNDYKKEDRDEQNRYMFDRKNPVFVFL